MNIDSLNCEELKALCGSLIKENESLKSQLNEYTLDLSKDEMEEQYRNYYN